MARVEFSFSGLDEFADDIRNVIQKYPDQTEKEIFHLAGVWTKDVNNRLSFKNPDTGKRPIKKSWKRSREYGGMLGAQMTSVEITNTAPHWHLIEHGHNVLADPKMFAAFKAGRLDHSKRKGKKKGRSSALQTLGFASGQHCAEQAREDWNGGIFAGHVRRFVDKMLKEENL